MSTFRKTFPASENLWAGDPRRGVVEHQGEGFPSHLVTDMAKLGAHEYTIKVVVLESGQQDIMFFKDGRLCPQIVSVYLDIDDRFEVTEMDLADEFVAGSDA